MGGSVRSCPGGGRSIGCVVCSGGVRRRGGITTSEPGGGRRIGWVGRGVGGELGSGGGAGGVPVRGGDPGGRGGASPGVQLIGGVEAGDIGDKTGMLPTLDTLFPEDSLLRLADLVIPDSTAKTGFTTSSYLETPVDASNVGAGTSTVCGILAGGILSDLRIASTV